MRYAFLISALSCAFCLFTGLSDAEDAQNKKAVAKTVVVDENPDSRIKHIDVDEPSGGASEKEYGVNSERPMPGWEEYDENTGLPDKVESDSWVEFE